MGEHNLTEIHVAWWEASMVLNAKARALPDHKIWNFYFYKCYMTKALAYLHYFVYLYLYMLPINSLGGKEIYVYMLVYKGLKNLPFSNKLRHYWPSEIQRCIFHNISVPSVDKRDKSLLLA